MNRSSMNRFVLNKKLLIRWTVFTISFLAIALPSWGQSQIFAFGDSITLGLRDTGVDCDNPDSARGYPDRLSNLLSDREIDNRFTNHGVCGETTSEGLERIKSVVEQPGDVMLLMEGTNDISAQVGIETMVFNLTEMGRLSLEAGFEPVYASIVPRGPDTSPDSNNVRTSFYGFRLSEEAMIDDVAFADPFNVMLNLDDAFETFYHEDGFHPNSLGYNVIANTFLQPTIDAISRAGVEPCVPDATTLCLNEGRYKVEVSWADFEGNTGFGQAEALTSDTGYFWFFNPDNIELTLKVLDGRCINDHFWVFYGALSNVEYQITVTDSETGRRRVYSNPLGEFASTGDTEAFPIPREDCSTEVTLSELDPTQIDLSAPFETVGFLQIPARSHPDLEPKRDLEPKGTSGPCVASNRILCLNDDRFELEVDWETPGETTGFGRAIPLTNDTGYFWFFNDTNVELVVKVLDGREINGNFWVFYGSLTNVEFNLQVTDLETLETASYNNPQGNFASVGDTEAFPPLP